MQAAGRWSLPSPPITLRNVLQAETPGTICLFTHRRDDAAADPADSWTKAGRPEDERRSQLDNT